MATGSKTHRTVVNSLVEDLLQVAENLIDVHVIALGESVARLDTEIARQRDGHFGFGVDAVVVRTVFEFVRHHEGHILCLGLGGKLLGLLRAASSLSSPSMLTNTRSCDEVFSATALSNFATSSATFSSDDRVKMITCGLATVLQR